MTVSLLFLITRTNPDGLHKEADGEMCLEGKQKPQENRKMLLNYFTLDLMFTKLFVVLRGEV